MAIEGVSSWFFSELESGYPRGIKARVVINGIDLAQKIDNLPTISETTKDISISNYSLKLPRVDTTSYYYKAPAYVSIGLTNPQSSTEWYNISSGTIGGISYNDNEINLNIQDRRIDIIKKQLGNATVPLNLTTSNYNIGDIAWIIATSYCNLSMIQSTTNEDLDYADFQLLTSNTSGYTFQAYSKGDDASKLFAAIEELAYCKFYSDNGKLSVKKLNNSSSSIHDYDSTNITKLELTAVFDFANTVRVGFGYNVSSQTWAGAVTERSLNSISSYGRRTHNIEDTFIWAANSVTAGWVASNYLVNNNGPRFEAKLDTGLMGLKTTAPDVITVTDELGFSNKKYRVLGRNFNMSKMEMQLTLEEVLAAQTLVKRYGRIAPSSYTNTYLTATNSDRNTYAFIASSGDLLANGSLPYYVSS